jgi:hypothetical protein
MEVTIAPNGGAKSAVAAWCEVLLVPLQLSGQGSMRMEIETYSDNKVPTVFLMLHSSCTVVHKR